ncbi:MAG: Holliday junction resolvase RuvX [Acidimicrobiales bacterium]
MERPWPAARIRQVSTTHSTTPAGFSSVNHDTPKRVEHRGLAPAHRLVPGTPWQGRATTLTKWGRAVGVDLGSRRIGVAVSDSRGVLASPRTTMRRSADPGFHRQALVDLAIEEGASVIVVGLPLSLSGHRGEAALHAESEAEALRLLCSPYGIDVELFDERLTTVTAHRSLVAGGKSSQARRQAIDRSAATVMLQAWLAARVGLR